MGSVRTIFCEACKVTPSVKMKSCAECVRLYRKSTSRKHYLANKQYYLEKKYAWEQQTRFVAPRRIPPPHRVPSVLTELTGRHHGMYWDDADRFDEDGTEYMTKTELLVRQCEQIYDALIMVMRKDPTYRRCIKQGLKRNYI